MGTHTDSGPAHDPGRRFPHLVEHKRALRRAVLRARTTRTSEDRTRCGTALAAHVAALPQVRAGSVVSAYVSVGTEPPTGGLLTALSERGVRVLLPALLPDGDLDWAPYVGPDRLAPAARGLLEPDATLTRLGPAAVADADLVLVPGLAADGSGHRLGRGGGSYDRALARVRTGATTAVLLYDDELLDDVPVEAHDRAVDLAVTPGGVHRFRGTTDVREDGHRR